MKLVDAPLVPAGAAVGRVLAWRGGRASASEDCLVEEVPVALVLNGVSHAVMLATPADLEDFALGFGLSEGLLAHAGELYGVDVVPEPQGLRLEMDVASACVARLKERRRSLAGRTGCGLCGAESLEQVRLPVAPLVGNGPRVAPPAVAQALSQLRRAQVLQQSTGAVHAAAWCSLSGEARIVREDVGRHNALDKTLGAMVRGGVEPAQGFLVVTSRASFEMVQKAVMARVHLLAAVSAPTLLAVQTAQQAGLTLLGFARERDFVAYTHPERLGLAWAGC
ncbi:MAG TPA: formate dehydrogenase accessory sulfurtransferase FdhD [Burkholderiaceae bacterium]|nr:formate dehydrogenase accessory sulfurtransferase FdhD [Burkholderiaceae bacterium]